MKFKEISFTDNNAKRVYSDYINRVKNAVKSLDNETQNETLLEINSHIYEGITLSQQNEMEGLLDVLEKLGNPDIFLKELVAEKQLEEATRSFNPVKIFKALLLNITNGFSYFIFLILYFTLFSFVFLIFAKIFNPENVGLFYRKNHFFILGKAKISDIDIQQYEYLGAWFIPFMILCIIVFYVLITFLIRLKKAINKK